LWPNLEIVVRVGCYAVVFAGMALTEWFAPRRRLGIGRRPRCPSNLGILIVDILAVRLLVPTTALGVALVASDRGWGLFPMLGLPYRAAIALGVPRSIWSSTSSIGLSLRAEALAAASHAPRRSRHRCDHRVRFHPLEILISLAIKFAAVVTLGVAAIAVLMFEVLLSATSMFNHSNVALPPRLAPVAHWIVVTPQMHQVHHSIGRAETDSNFGFNMPWWDRLFGT
jgi:fatty acid hydroxylase family protein